MRTKDKERFSPPPNRFRVDVFLTVDQGVEYQQNLLGLNLAIVVMVAKTNDIKDLLPLMPSVQDVLQ